MLLPLLFSLNILRFALACSPPPPRDTYTDGNNTSSYPYAVPGPEGSLDPATTGYFINHVSLNTNNLTRSLDFYTRVIGMRHMFTYHLTQHLSLTYMAHSQGGRNGTGYQTTEELLRYKNNAAGLIELVHFNTSRLPGDPAPIPGPDKFTSTLSHLGIIVPDPTATQARLEEYGVTIYKKVGEPMPKDGPLGNKFSLGDARGLSDEDFEAIQKVMSELGMLNIFAADPDGNLLEILPLNEPNLFG